MGHIMVDPAPFDSAPLSIKSFRNRVPVPHGRNRTKIVSLCLSLGIAALLASCGSAPEAQVPEEVAGTWGADCTQPFVKFAGSKMTVFPDKATYDLKRAAVANGQLIVAYDTKSAEVSEVYLIEGTTLRLDHGKYGGADATWHKAPMRKCD
ncbi:MAG: hypothetical protein JWM47_4496 [Acidimicrobiales bacterium]|nr:hypothetical protein [Acidimicrobiales bacterium]